MSASPETLVTAAGRLLLPEPGTVTTLAPGLRARAAAVLLRMALDQALDAYWQRVTPSMTRIGKHRMLCLEWYAGHDTGLRINYRSTEEILAWSTGILSPVSVDDLGGDGSDTLAGYRSLLHGRRPHVNGYGSEQVEIAALVERVEGWIAQGIRPSEIGVCARFNVLLDKAYDKLAAARVPVVRVRDNPGSDAEGVRLATMHAMKGLEFRCVAVLGATASALPFAREVTPASVDALQHDSDLLRERCLLFVACTRAREALAVSWSGSASPFVPQAK